MIAVVDYGMGNLRSVQKGFEKAGCDALVSGEVKSIEKASKIVLPGVGAFRDCMRNLEERGLAEPVIRHIEKGKPFLGICLGLQLLFEESEEFGAHKGLGVIKGKVKRFPQREHLKVPHMGWNSVNKVKEAPLLANIKNESYFYFVHSYYILPEEDVAATTTDYGLEFVSSIWKDNIFACQFHPEKSQSDGLNILKAFGELN
ncbi:MAG: imidazole glycerol phosphate synthase subunit HisH [Deltaproteobacteria bacterium]|nr:imidazole glycerol phosphate synthase subunit HisH [Deltaproteobacteria bacterium]